jgi:hypothetical protein
MFLQTRASAKGLEFFTEGFMKLKFYLFALLILSFFVSCSEQPIRIGALSPEEVHNFFIPSSESMVRTFSKSPKLDDKTIEYLKDSKIILHTFSNQRRVIIRNTNGYISLGSDIILGKSSELPQAVSEYEQNLLDSKLSTQGIGRVATTCAFNFFGCRIYMQNKKLWPGRIAYVFDSDALNTMQDPYYRNLWAKAIFSWNKTSPIQLQPRRYKEPYILFKGNWPAGSLVGNYNTIINTDDQSGQPVGIQGCYSEWCFHHEVGHVLGLKHEHQRCDRDRFLNFSFNTNDGIFITDYGKTCDAEFKDYGLYSFDSIMHYSLGTTGNPYGIEMKMEAKNQLPAGEYRGQPSQAGKMERLSESDRLSILAMYNLSDVPNIVTSNKTYTQVKQIGGVSWSWQDWKDNNAIVGSQGGSGIEAIRIHVRSPYGASPDENPEETLYVEYATDVSKIGWTEYVRNGGVSGTTGNGAPIKGLQIVLRGTHEAKYRCSLSFRVSAKSGGWQPWVQNGYIGYVNGQDNFIDAVQLNVSCLGPQ